MNKALQFRICLEQARRIVSAYRLMAPIGVDPKNSVVAIGVGVAGVAVSAGVSAYEANKNRAQAAKLASANQSLTGTVKPLQFPAMPAYVPVDFNKIEEQAVGVDRGAYKMSNDLFSKENPDLVRAQNLFKQRVAAQQAGDKTLLPQLQAEYMTAGLGSALGAFGTGGTALGQGSGAQADVAKNLGLDVLGFQQQQEQRANASLSLAEQIFPHKQVGLSGADAAQIALGNLSAQNAWNQANYATGVDEMEFNQKIAAGNAASQIQSNNATAAAQAQLGAAQAQMMGSLATSALSTAGNAYGRYMATPAAAPTYGAGVNPGVWSAGTAIPATGATAYA